MNNVRLTLNGRIAPLSCLDDSYDSLEALPWLQVCSRGSYQLLRIAIEAVVVGFLCLGWSIAESFSRPASIGLCVMGIEAVALGLTVVLPSTTCDVTVSKRGVRGDQGGCVPWDEIEHIEVVPATLPSLDPIAWFVGNPQRFNCLRIYRTNGDIYLCQMRNSRASVAFCKNLVNYIVNFGRTLGVNLD